MSYIYGAPNNARKWQMEFNSAFKRLKAIAIFSAGWNMRSREVDSFLH
jgi:hypothetical protein